MGCRLARLRYNRNGFETHNRGGRIEDRKGECVREGEKIIPKCVAGVVARGKVTQEKVACLYTRLSSKSHAGKSRLSLHSSVFTRAG